MVSQRYLEPILVNNAAARGASFAFNTNYLDHAQDDTGVNVEVEDRVSGRRHPTRCKYLIGADGCHSRIAAQLGLPFEGHMGRAGTVYVLFHADLSRYVAHRPSILYWLMVPDASVGEIGMGLLRAVRPWHTWIAGWGFDVNAAPPDTSRETALAKIRTYVGDPDLAPDIQGTFVWHVNQAYATRYSSGRVFCAGDAVHRQPPSSGLGNNTCIQDAFNLAWKLAYVIQGHADPSLLDTYSEERTPVGKQVVRRANQSRLDYAPLNEAFRTDGQADPVTAGLTKINDPGPDGVEVRRQLLDALLLKNYEFNAQGVELNQRYTSSAVISDPTAGEETWEHDPQLYLQATTRPGAKIPHWWLIDEHGHRVSTLDLTGKGKFTLLTGLAGGAWQRRRRRCAIRLAVPHDLRPHRVAHRRADRPRCHRATRDRRRWKGNPDNRRMGRLCGRAGTTTGPRRRTCRVRTPHRVRRHARRSPTPTSIRKSCSAATDEPTRSRSRRCYTYPG